MIKLTPNVRYINLYQIGVVFETLYTQNVGKVVDRHGENRSCTTSRGVATLDSSRHVPKYKFDNFFFL